MNVAPRIMLTRASTQSASILEAVRQVGLDPVVVPAIQVDLTPPSSDLDAAARCLHTYRWVVITSPNGAAAILTAAERVEAQLGIPGWAAIGAGTRRVLEAEGIDVAFSPVRADAATLAEGLDVTRGDRVLVIRGDLAGDALATSLRRRSARVDDVIAYRTLEAPSSSLPILQRAVDGGPIAAVVFTSGSTVRGLLSLAGRLSIDLRQVPAVCIGRATAEAATAAGFRVAAVAETPDPMALAAATAAAVARQPVEVS